MRIKRKAHLHRDQQLQDCLRLAESKLKTLTANMPQWTHLCMQYMSVGQEKESQREL